MQAILRFPYFFKVDAFQELTDEMNDVVSLSYTIVFLSSCCSNYKKARRIKMSITIIWSDC
jgi:hypothetical protein